MKINNERKERIDHCLFVFCLVKRNHQKNVHFFLLAEHKYATEHLVLDTFMNENVFWSWMNKYNVRRKEISNRIYFFFPFSLRFLRKDGITIQIYRFSYNSYNIYIYIYVRVCFFTSLTCLHIQTHSFICFSICFFFLAWKLRH